MADAINTINRVPGTFKVNKYDDIDGGRVAQLTARGRLCFRDTVTNRMTLPRTAGEASFAVYPVDWAKPLNPPPYFDGPGLNGNPIHGLDDGSLTNQDTNFQIDPDVAFQIPWPAAFKTYELPPELYNLPVTSGNKCLIYDGESTVTYGSGAYMGAATDYGYGQRIYAEFSAGNEGKITVSGAGLTAVGRVINKDVFGTDTLTVK